MDRPNLKTFIGMWDHKIDGVQLEIKLQNRITIDNVHNTEIGENEIGWINLGCNIAVYTKENRYTFALVGDTLVQIEPEKFPINPVMKIT